MAVSATPDFATLEAWIDSVRRGKDFSILAVLADLVEEKGWGDPVTTEVLRGFDEPHLHVSGYEEISSKDAAWPEDEDAGEVWTKQTRNEDCSLEDAVKILEEHGGEPSVYPLDYENCHVVWFQTEFQVANWETGEERRGTLHIRMAGQKNRVNMPRLLAYLVYRLAGYSVEVKKWASATFSPRCPPTST